MMRDCLSNCFSLKAEWAKYFVLLLVGLVSTLEGQVDTRIVGGKEAVPGSRPWITALVFGGATDFFNEQFCGGSLVHPYYVVTAAHCMFDDNDDLITNSDVDVVLGLHRLDDSTFQQLQVAQIILHPSYNDVTSDSDIALLRLASPAIGVELLPIIDDPALADPGVMATSIGWGNTSPDQDNPVFPVELREVSLPIVSLSVANQSQSYNGELTPNMLPAGFAEGGKDSCQGDSGGPLVVDGAFGAAPVLAGVVSFGIGCADPDFYGIYTRVSEFRPWIKSFLTPLFASWEIGHAVSGENNDPDKDGLNNFIEYLLQSDPNIPSSKDNPTVGIVDSGESQFAAITFRLRKAREELSYIVQISTNLKDWTDLDSGAFMVGAAESIDTDTEQITVRSNIPLDGNNAVFLRLKGKFSGNLVTASP